MSYYAHLALQELHILPNVFFKLHPKTRKFIIASIQYRSDEIKKSMKKK